MHDRQTSSVVDSEPEPHPSDRLGQQVWHRKPSPSEMKSISRPPIGLDIIRAYELGRGQSILIGSRWARIAEPPTLVDASVELFVRFPDEDGTRLISIGSEEIVVIPG